MRIPRPFVALLGFLFVCVISITSAEMHNGTLSSAPVNSPPVAGDDTYSRHGNGVIGPLKQNDSDPDGDPMTVQILTFPTHGNLSGLDGNSFHYALTNQSFTGTDTFTYRVCDNQSACSNVATVTINVVNQAPVGGDDSYTVHGVTTIGPMMVNDYDPDGDAITWTFDTAPTHGSLFGLTQQDLKSYTPHIGYTGPDSFTYKLCDQFSMCSPPITVNLNIVNNPPVPGPDAYVVRGSTIIGPLMVNDFDPDGDSMGTPSLVVAASHGSVFGLADPNFKQYVPHAGYTGTDTFQYQITDSLGASGTTTVTLYVIAGDDAQNNGKNPCDSVGEPVNVTNGNMYVEQHDFSLSSLGFPIDITRTYNSRSQQIGLFGRGWSTAYDSSLAIYDSNMVRLNEDDGRATNFGRPAGSSGAFAPLEGDFHGQLIQSGGAFSLSMADGSSSQFNSAGKLLATTDRNNNTTTLTYNASGFLSSVTNAFGRVLTVTTNTNGRVISISDTLGTAASYTYGGSDELLSVTYADNSAFNYTYNGNLRLTSVADALGNVRESHTYDSQGRALTSEKHGGVELYTLNYVSDTQTDVTDGLGRLTKYTIDKSKGRNVVTKVEGVCSCGGGSGSQVQTWVYDSDLNITSKTNALGHVTSYTYDDNGNTLTETDAAGTITRTYNQFSEVLTQTDQMNGVTTNVYDAQGNLLTKTDALNNTTSFTYDTRGQLLTTTDARGKLYTFTYDATGNQTQRKDPNNLITFFFFDARSRLTKIRDGQSRSILYGYDAAGRIIKLTHPDLSFVSFTHDLAGRLTTVTDERGNPTQYAYDSAYRLSSITNATNQTTSYTYDAMSNRTAITDPLGRVTNYDYDDFNRVVKITYPPAITGGSRLFETFTYDAAGNVTERIDTAGRVTSSDFDNLNRVVSSTDADNKSTTYAYDDLSRVTSLVDSLNQAYEFAYDALGRETQITRSGVSMSYVYDAVGNRTQRTDYNGVTTNYAYDNLNRVASITYPARTVTYAYLVTGQLSRATNENGSVYIGYDNRYRVSSVSDPFYYGVSYNYDTAGNRTKLKLNGATYATYTYDTLNRLTNLADSANQNFPHAYDAVDRLTSRGAPNGITSSYGYDGLSRLTGLTHAAGGNLIGNQYTYDDANNIANWTNASGNHGYAYDPVDRLTSATNSAQPNENYSYDGVGNRTASHLSATYNYQPFNQLTNTATASYVYDNNGNLLSKTDSVGSTVFSWNEENQLTQTLLPNGLTVNYKYDALGRRIQRTTSAGASERYVYDGHDVLLDLNADWSVATTYLSDLGIDNKLRQTSSTTGVSYYLSDHLGSTAGLTDASGNMVEQVAYDSYGNSAGSAFTRYTYTGRERDPDTGLLYYRARFYDPQLGRFVNEDPIGLLGGLNLFAYVENRPTNGIDPFGLQQLAPLGRNGRTRRDIPRAELERLMTPRGGRGLPDDVKKNLDRGCIGMCSAYQGSGEKFPENAPGTFCYLDENLAKARKCPKCCRNFVFAVQGEWNPASTSNPDPKSGRIANDAISHAGPYNYIVWFPSTRSYAWMNHEIGGKRPQMGTISILPSDEYSNTIWCSTCKKKR